MFALRPEAAIWAGDLFCAVFIYSLEIKKHLVLDVLVLAALFTIRVFAGGAAIGVVGQPVAAHVLPVFIHESGVSQTVYRSHGPGREPRIPRCGYRKDDVPCIFMAGIVNAYISVLVFALYINSSAVLALYSRPQLSRGWRVPC